MIEQQLRAGLDRALADEPPLAFDADRLIATAQRQSQRRRALAGVGAATAVVAVAAVAVPTLLHGADRRVTTATPPSEITTAPHTTAPHATAPHYPWPPSGTHTRTYDTAQLNSLTNAWTRELRHVFPTVVPDARDVSVQQWDHDATDSTPTKRNFTDTFVRFTVHGVTTSVSIEVYAPGADPTGPNARCAQDSSHSLASSVEPPPGVRIPPDTCQITLRGDTALLREMTTTSVPDTSTPTSAPGRQLSVTQFRADGSVVGVSAYNYDPAGNSDVTAAQPPLTAAQLTTLVTDPDLGF
ncbi:MAG TPA: hypothetical protein VFW65_25785 [Pseudonocardiaceae bacterium]|nr:hypothetical protein [Pseudonocardiaceae bacterium]